MTMGRCDVNPSKQCKGEKGVLLQTAQLLIEKLHRKSARNENPNIKFILNKLEMLPEKFIHSCPLLNYELAILPWKKRNPGTFSQSQNGIEDLICSWKKVTNKHTMISGISHLFDTRAKDIATIKQRSLGFFIGTTFIQQLELQFVIFYLCEL